MTPWPRMVHEIPMSLIELYIRISLCGPPAWCATCAPSLAGERCKLAPPGCRALMATPCSGTWEAQIMMTCF